MSRQCRVRQRHRDFEAVVQVNRPGVMRHVPCVMCVSVMHVCSHVSWLAWGKALSGHNPCLGNTLHAVSPLAL